MLSSYGVQRVGDSGYRTDTLDYCDAHSAAGGTDDDILGAARAKASDNFRSALYERLLQVASVALSAKQNPNHSVY